MKDSLAVVVIVFSAVSAIGILYLLIISIYRNREKKAVLKLIEQNRVRIDNPRNAVQTTRLSSRLQESGAEVPQKSEILRLLREHSTESRRQAISSIRKFRMVTLSEELCNCLSISSLQREAAAALEEFGDEAVHGVINYCSRVQGNFAECRSALRLLGKCGNPESSSFLFNSLWDESREVREEASRALAGSDFFFSPAEKNRIITLVEDVTDTIAWDFAAGDILIRNSDNLLLELISADIARWKEYLFRLLSIAYGSGSVNLIERHLTNSMHGGSLAGKLILNIVDDSVSNKLRLVLIPMPEKVRQKKLARLYPSEMTTYDELAEAIINRDYNQLDLWVKACLLRRLPEIRSSGMQESVSALLFSHEEIMREESARLMARTNREMYWSVSERIADPFRRRLDRIVMGNIEKDDLLYEKVIFLSGKFLGVPKYELIRLSGNLVHAHEFGIAAPGESCIIWPLKTRVREVAVHLKSSYDACEWLPASDEPCYILPMSALEEFRLHYPDHADEVDAYLGYQAEINESL